MIKQYSRIIPFEEILNFRDLGGYKARGGRTIAWRRIFRSGAFSHMTPDDYRKLTEEIKLASIVDLRSDFEVKRDGIGLPEVSGIKYYNVSLLLDGGKTEAETQRYKAFSNMGEFYLNTVRDKGFGRHIVQALEIIAKTENHPLDFHCAVGKDRTGMLAAMLLSALGVADKDIIEDYTLSSQVMAKLRQQLTGKGKAPEGVPPLPDFFWKAEPESMSLFLTTLRKDYGSIPDYLKLMGAENSLTQRLEKALLV